MKRIVRLKELGVGDFAEDKALAQEIGREEILPKLMAGKRVVVDFWGVEAMSEMFFRGLIGEAVLQCGERAYREVKFRNVEAEIEVMMEEIYKCMQV